MVSATSSVSIEEADMKLPPSPTRPRLDRLLEEAGKMQLTPQEIWDQRVSFAFGQMMDCSPEVTRDQVEARAVELYGPRPS